MAGIGVSEAARMIGRDASTVHRMMKSGRLSYSVNSSGRRRLDPAELGRLFEVAAMHGNGAMQSIDSPRGMPCRVWRCCARRCDQGCHLADLQRRLDASEAERRAVQERLTAILTHRQPGSVPAVAPASAARRPGGGAGFDERINDNIILRAKSFCGKPVSVASGNRGSRIIRHGNNIQFRQIPSQCQRARILVCYGRRSTRNRL